MNKKHFIIFLFLSLVVFIFPQTAIAQEKKLVVLEKDEVIDEDYFAYGETVTLSGVVNGDAYLAGSVVLVDGMVNGDLFVGAGTFTLLGQVSDDLRVGAGEVLIDGLIGKNLTVGGANAMIAKGAMVNGSLLAFAGSLEVNGPIGRGANLFTGRALLGNKVGGHVSGSIGELTLTSGAAVGGDLKYQSPQEATMAKEATVSGEIIYELVEEKDFGPAKWGGFEKSFPQLMGRSLKKTGLAFKIISFILSFTLGWLLVRLWPKRVAKTITALELRPWLSLLIGFAAPLVVLSFALVLILTIIGIPLVFLLFFLFGILLYLGRIFAILCAGQRILRGFGWQKTHLRALLAGLCLYYFLQILPVIRVLTVIAFASLGFGAFVLSFKKKAARKASK